MLYGIKTFLIIISIAIIYNIIFIGDLLYLTNYAIKENFIRNNFNVLIFYKESCNILFKLCLLLVLLLAIFFFYHKVKRQKFISSCIISIFIMFISGSLALNIIQYKAKYQVIYTYGNQGVKDLVRSLAARITLEDRIIAPYEVFYYLGAQDSGFLMRSADLISAENFLNALNRIKPTYVVYGIASNTIKQYKDVFSSKLISEYFRANHFISKNIGSYTLWMRIHRE